MSGNQNVRVSVDERKIGKAAGSAVSGELKGELSSIKSNTSETADQVREMKREVSALQRRVESLEERMTEIERTKAEAQREATESIKDELERQLEEKKRQFEEKKRDVLGDYQSSIRRLKDRFVNSIPGQSEGFERVTEEFDRAVELRDSVVEEARRLGSHGAAAVHEYRRRHVEESRTAFTDAIDDFLADRRETANTIDSLQTAVPGVDGNERVHVPFWVVGIERDGREEVYVLPIQTRAEPEAAPTARAPYASYLKPHDTHYYGDWTDAVEAYVRQDHVRDRLAADDPTFADPDVLRDLPGVHDRFVDALTEFEFGDRRTTGSTTRRAGQAQRQRQAARTGAQNDD
ncbi:MAG: hypothetical protein ABEJ40_05780 [Haloarculaceae archaeon]